MIVAAVRTTTRFDRFIEFDTLLARGMLR